MSGADGQQDASDPNAWDAIEAELDALLALDADARAQRLERIAAHDATLAARLREWLASIDAAGDFLDAPGPRAVESGERLGPWRLVEAIGRGGMGEVWRGERADGAFERTVAIKLLRRDRPGSPRQLARERELLARLRHPGIAQLLDGGVTSDGQPWLVTEWVEGVTLDVWLRARPRGLHQRIAILRGVIDAVAYAHANLVVHRDLKPGNVMVDAANAPRLLDFGIARLLDASSLHAQTADRALTPGFAAPEQVRGEAITTRTDVHGLGALLYWLLAERAPHEAGAESLQRWVERVSTQEPRAPRTLPQRPTGFEIDADLEAIVMKALRSDPAQRHASADALAQDLAAWQRGDPVSARRPTRRERVRRFARRHRGGVLAAGLLALAIASGVAGTLWQAQAARREAARATAVKDFLLDLFSAIDPERARGEPVRVEELVARGERELPLRLASEPALQYEMLNLLSSLRLSLVQTEPRLADLERLCPIAEQVHGDPSAELAGCWTERADAYHQLGRGDEAKDALARALRIGTALSPRDPLPLATAMRVQFALARAGGDNADAERIIRAAIDVARPAEPGIGPQTAFMLEDLAVLLAATARLDEAIATMQQVLRFDDAQPRARAAADQVNSRWNRLTMLWQQQDFARVIDEVVAVAEFTTARVGRNHPHSFRLQQLRGLAQSRLGRYRDAVATFEAALAIDGIDGWEGGRFRQILGAELPSALAAIGRNADALALATDLLAAHARGTHDPGYAFVTSHGALMAALAGGDATVVARWQAELERRFDALPPAQQDARRGSLLHARAIARRATGDARGALALYDEVARLYLPASGTPSLLGERVIAEQGFALLESGDAVTAAARLRDARARLRARFGAEHVAVAQIEAALARLPGDLATADERARRESALQRFRTATGRELDLQRVL